MAMTDMVFSSHEPRNVPFGYSDSLNFSAGPISPSLFEPSDGNITMMYKMLHDGPRALWSTIKAGPFLKVSPLPRSLPSLFRHSISPI